MNSADNDAELHQAAEQGLGLSYLCRWLSGEQRQELRQQMTVESFGPDQRIFAEGDHEYRLHVLGAGKVKIGRALDSRPCRLLDVLGPGDLVDGFPTLTPRPKRVTAVAMTEVITLSLHYLTLQNLARRWPEIGFGFADELDIRLRVAEQRRIDQTRLDIPGRLAVLFVRLARRYGVRQGESVTFQHHMDQIELADLIGASREGVNKAIAEFVARGWIQSIPKGVCLLRPAALARRAR
ncbi:MULTISPECIES: Crp/Fnr family transcriptional regulator [unclassified Crossiella]|uniref:Crp/Fnr family transcriptional regulator n=1 Tax=unclassified Crossiella TaxID=2620835 RepID=UPI001FFFEC34|nr:MULTISPECIES: Crp/Fnr family transcriptional regulator [unclassified Crossiella]MCK2240992.1 Crp/Fnr family transcriptional regulator [Crossiella sp. S99.2]MCK2253864.1 Crp/Fnr family transcriptional regulator [Crossiella sp. S99.1]